MMRAIRRLLPTLLLLLVAVLLAAGGRAGAESVRIQGPAGQDGQGWVFGSTGREAGACWIVMPLHVVADPRSGRPGRFLFFDQHGRGGQSGMPVAVADVSGAVEAAGGVGDLAFARVAVGTGAPCLSRLGLPPLAYEVALRRAPRLQILSLLPTSFGLFEATVSRARVDAAGGGLIELRPLRAEDAAIYLKQGLSGSVAQLDRAQGAAPFAMTIEVVPDRQVVRALRFDLVRAAFALVEATAAVTEDRAAAEGEVAYRIVGFDARSLDPAHGPDALHEPAGCWPVVAAEGRAAVRVTVEAFEPGRVIRGLSLQAGRDCGEALPFGIDQRVPGTANWTRVRDCRSGDTAACFLELRTPRELRITLPGKQPTALGGLRLSGD